LQELQELEEYAGIAGISISIFYSKVLLNMNTSTYAGIGRNRQELHFYF
jgi:hypothetical protein